MFCTRTFRRFPSRASLACLPAIGLVVLASSSTASAARTPVSTPADTRAALEHLVAGLHPASHTADLLTIGGSALKKITSHTWSGYADDNSTGKVYRSVSAKWKEPAITGCTASSPEHAVLFAVGLDGLTSPTVEQGGSGAICGAGHKPFYFTWWAMGAVGINMVASTVKPGDSISASVIRTGSSYTIAVSDSTTAGNSFTVTQGCTTTCANSSAEWVAEAPVALSTELPMPNFGTWTVTSATVKAGSTSGTIKTFPDDEITMNNTTPPNVAQPGALNSKGNSFKDLWKA